MKQFATLLIIAISLIAVSCKEKAPTIESSASHTSNKIEIIDFYGTHRCITCKAIEASAKYTVDTYFAEEQKKGILVFKTINVDDDKNYNIAENFEATGTALFINLIKDGKETHIDLTDFGFSKAMDQEDFASELKSKIEKELNKL